jgi:hypothetical protein
VEILEIFSTNWQENSLNNLKTYILKNSKRKVVTKYGEISQEYQ